jgi:hypothetical protein
VYTSCTLLRLPELFSGALCFGGNNVAMPLEWCTLVYNFHSPSMLPSGLKTLQDDWSAIGFLGGDGSDTVNFDLILWRSGTVDKSSYLRKELTMLFSSD